MYLLTVLAALLIPVCASLVTSFLFAGYSWQKPFFSLIEGLVSIGVLIIAFGIFISHYLKLEKANENSLEDIKLIVDELERQLKQNTEDRERFELFVQATGDGIWDWNLSDNKFYFSSRWKSMLGFADDEFVGSFVEWQNLVHPEDLGKLLMMWSKCTEGETSYTIEYRIKNKSGYYIWVASRAIALIDENGDVYRLAGSHTDITEKKEAELKLLNHQKYLEAEIAASTAELEQANKLLRELASIDGLTGLNNRRAFDEAIKREWNRCKREHKTFSLIMLDIDFFKKYNDTFGHLEGDIVLKKLSGALTATVRRATDIVARYGGEEFVVILPDADEKQVLDAARKIQKHVDELNIPAVKESTYKNVTFSMGIGTTMPSDINSWESTLEQVDQALYKAKETGRNKIIVSPLNVVNLKRPNAQ
jgi:diguanylate cyclase (GGDEF)-like protein/PAS domain S-box-containing protein